MLEPFLTLNIHYIKGPLTGLKQEEFLTQPHHLPNLLRASWACIRTGIGLDILDNFFWFNLENKALVLISWVSNMNLFLLFKVFNH